jgi:hypothetical protein
MKSGARSSRIGKFVRASHGAVTIEFVCTLPLFLAALAFAFEFGQFFLAHQSTVHNVRAASRYLSRTDLGFQARSVARTIVRTGQITNGTTPDYLADADVDVEREDIIDPGDPNKPSIQIWKISARVEYEPVLFGFLGGQNVSIPFVVREDFRIARF